MAASSPSLQTNLYASSSKFCFARSDRFKRRSFSCKKNGHSTLIIKSVLNNKPSSINGDEAIEPSRILLERLFAQTQKLEQKIGKDSDHDIESELNLAKLESDLQTALTALKKKEEDLEAAEHKIMLEYRDLENTKTTAFLRQKKLEDELKRANLDLGSQATEIEDLKLQLEKRDNELMAAWSGLTLKENELNIMIDELRVKSEEASKTESELRSKLRCLVETNDVLNKQAVEIEELRKSVHEKDEELQISMTSLESGEAKLKAVEENLEKQTMDWLVAQEELKKLVDESSDRVIEVNETLEDFTRVRTLLGDVRSELVCSQKALAQSRVKMEFQQEVLEKRLVELGEHCESLSSYTKSLEDAKIEIESERMKLRLAEARKQELERDLSVENDLIDALRKQLNDEKLFLRESTKEVSVLRDELERRKSEYGETEKLLEAKESELVEARLEIQHLESELSSARKKLCKVNQEVSNLKSLLSCRDKQVETIQHDLNESKTKFSEATNVIQQIVELTNKLVTSGFSSEPTESSFGDKKRLENELDAIRETLRSREIEVLASQRALTIKDNELKIVVRKLEEREKEMKELKQELTQDADNLRKLYAIAQERIGERSIGELAIEKLELEAARLEVEAATSALQKIMEMSRELLRTTSLSVEGDYDLDISMQNGSENEVRVFEDRCFAELKTEVARLSDLTEKLIQEGGVVADSGVVSG